MSCVGCGLAVHDPTLRAFGSKSRAAVERCWIVLPERRLRQRFSDEDEKSSHFAFTGPGFAVGTSVSYSRMLGGIPIRVGLE